MASTRNVKNSDFNVMPFNDVLLVLLCIMIIFVGVAVPSAGKKSTTQSKKNIDVERVAAQIDQLKLSFQEKAYLTFYFEKDKVFLNGILLQNVDIAAALLKNYINKGTLISIDDGTAESHSNRSYFLARAQNFGFTTQVDVPNNINNNAFKGFGDD